MRSNRSEEFRFERQEGDTVATIDERTVSPTAEEDSTWEIVTIDTPDGPHRVKRRRRIKKKRTPSKSIVWKTVIGAALIIGLFTLPLPIGQIQVTGTNQLSSEDVVAIGDLGYPVNILRVRTGALEERLQKDMRVDTAHVSYALPLTLQVDVKERTAVVVVPSQFGFVALDRQGMVIASSPTIPDTTVPIISGVRLGNALLGDTIESEGIRGAITYMMGFPEDKRKQIGEINVGDAEHIIAYTVDGLPIHIGDRSDLEEKAKITTDMIQDVSQRHVSAEFIDVNIKSPYIKTQ
ncbi:cell division protein FtsQ/DivIB [Veillonella sp. CHU740]|uniref:cell division protein FtsQ/DivIB n=1 Tax=Veillonella sp. CHU740 TaxID=2490950 RepID=UPI000F8C9802|nr:FtsQ-type POTRA domain-containing protein [Veillonella sp. CHU740]